MTTTEHEAWKASYDAHYRRLRAKRFSDKEADWNAQYLASHPSPAAPARSARPHWLDGADIPAALKLLIGDAGGHVHAVAVRQLALTLSVSPSTVYRWLRGTYRPSEANFARLRELAERVHAHETAAPALTARATTAQATLDALTTDADRAEEARLAADIVASLPRLRELNGV